MFKRLQVSHRMCEVTYNPGPTRVFRICGLVFQLWLWRLSGTGETFTFSWSRVKALSRELLVPTGQIARFLEAVGFFQSSLESHGEDTTRLRCGFFEARKAN